MKFKRDKKLAESFRGKSCEVCGTDYGTEGDHIITIGSYGSLADKPFNVWCLCRRHHTEKGHSLKRFVEKYNLSAVLLSRGFERCMQKMKWFHPKITCPE